MTEARDKGLEFIGRRDEVEKKLISAGLIDQMAIKRAADKYDIWGEHFVDEVCGYLFDLVYSWQTLYPNVFGGYPMLLKRLLRSNVPRADTWQIRCSFYRLLRDDWDWDELPAEIETLAAAMADLRSRQDKIQWHIRQARKIAAGASYIGMGGDDDETKEDARSAYKRLVGSPRKRAKT